MYNIHMRRLWDFFLVLWGKYERVFWLGTLVLGFVFDLFLAKSPESVADNILLVSYLFIAAACIVLLNIHTLRSTKRAHADLLSVTTGEPILLILILQFCFGGLASNLLILYGKSGTLGGSALFVLLLAAFALGNEFLKSRYALMRLNIAVYYFLLVTYLVIAVPTFVIHKIGMPAFLVSVAASAVVMLVLAAVLYVAVFRHNRRQLFEMLALVGTILLTFVGLYVLNIIPPVPLSLKSVGVYHSITVLPDAATRSDGARYAATLEPADWFVFWRDTSATFTVASSANASATQRDLYTAAAGEDAYCFSAVYAPGGLSTPIVHRWEQYDTAAQKWQTRSLVSFAINGGRADGYRGYTVETPSVGQWRCDVETSSGQLIGRISFAVVAATTTPTLSTTTL